MVTGSCRRQKPVPLQNSPSARGCKFPLVICNEERGKRGVAPPRRGESRRLSVSPSVYCPGRWKMQISSGTLLVNLPVTSCLSGVVSSYTLYVHKCLVTCYRCPPQVAQKVAAEQLDASASAVILGNYISSCLATRTGRPSIR